MSGHMFRAARSRFAWPVLIVGLVVCACASSSGKATLHIYGDSGAAGYFQDRVAVRRPITVQTFSVCTDGAPVRVSAVRLDDPRGLRLVDWGWHPFSGGLGAQPGLATKLRLGYTQAPITRKCYARGGVGTIVAVSVERTGPDAGTTRSFTMRFEGGSLTVPYGIALCPAKCTREELATAGG